MSLTSIITSLRVHSERFPLEKNSCEKTIAWIEKYGDFAFVKENLEGHITASLWIIDPSETKVLLMFHKRFQMWTQFGGHCDGESNTLEVAVREFHEESGVLEEPKIIGDILSVQVWDIAERTSSSGMFQPAHQHYDILYLGEIPEDVAFIRQEDEVDDIRWIDLHEIQNFISDERMIRMLHKIKNLGK